MKHEKLYDAITGIRDDILDRAEKAPPKKARSHRKKRWTAAIAAALAVAFIGGALLWPGGSPLVSPAYAIAEAQYPDMAPYPNEEDYFGLTGTFDDEGFSKIYNAWWKDIQAQRRPEGYADGLESFFAASTQQFLSGAGAANQVYSPLNVYMALGMLAELTGGSSRQQILDTLGSQSIEALRSQASDLWNATYRQDGAVSSVLASSLWLNQEIDFVPSTLDTLAETYYASSYQGEMGSDGFNKALQAWLNEQTGGLLEEQASQIQLSPDTVLALATTVLFHSKWSQEFNPSATKAGVFHASTGDVTCDFMYQSQSKNYYWADQFCAVSQHLESGGDMWFLLPDDGVSVDELLAGGQAMDFILKNGDWENQSYLIVNQFIPKFDVTSQLDLKEGFQALGITDVFDPERSDYTPMTQDTDQIYLSKAQHDARVIIDEEGCTAVAYTVMANAGASQPPEEEVDFLLDRPFLFAITNRDGLPLFVGVVNQPV